MNKKLLTTDAAIGLLLLVQSACGGQVPPERPPSAPGSPSAAAVAVPAALHHLWLGDHAFVSFEPTGRLKYDEVRGWPLLAVGDGSMVVGTDESGDTCRPGERGTYRWTLSDGGGWLAFQVVDEECRARQNMLRGTLERSDCPSFPDNFCLGPLEKGRHRSTYFRPMLPAEDWVLERGALTYLVPEGWTNVADHPDEYSLQQADTGDRAGVYLWSELAIVSSDSPCSIRPDPAIGRTAEAMVTWLLANPVLEVTEQRQVTIGGLPGLAALIQVKPEAELPCLADARRFAPMFVDADGAGLQWGFHADTHQHLYFLDLPDERALVISIEGQGQDAFASIHGEATEIVASMEFRQE